MSIAHRPSDETLGAFATGKLDEGLALVIAAHLEADVESRRRLQDLNAIHGALLDAAEPVSTTRDARLLIADQAAAQDKVRATSATPELPRVLQPYEIGPWRPIGIKIALRRVAVPDADARVFMLRAGPGVSLPHHKHSGQEWTTILTGAYEHEFGRFEAGDFDEADAEHDHTPRVDPVEGCTCLVALTGDVLFQGWLGRLLQPLVRL